MAPPAPLVRVIFLWHLLSLDGPTVAVVWMVFLARLNQVFVPVSMSLAMGIAVWTLYAADRLHDANRFDGSAGFDLRGELELRHLFHHRHREGFGVALVLASILLVFLIPQISHGAMVLYLVEGALLSGYFLLIHVAPIRLSRGVPKELLVGLFFAAATSVPTLAGAAASWPTLVIDVSLFSAVCMLNCLYIYVWEHPDTDHPHGPTRAALRVLPYCTVALITLSLGALVFSGWARDAAFYPTACLLSAFALLLLNYFRSHLSRLGLRTAADAALLTPMLFFAFR